MLTKFLKSVARKNTSNVYLRLVLLFFIVLQVFFSACDSKKDKLLYESRENWGEWHAGDTTSIHYKTKAIKSGNDTVYIISYYYPNGVEKTKIELVNDRLMTIYFVNDTNGKPYDFGKLSNGNGYVRQYDHKGKLSYSGTFQNGYKEGWWMTYHFTGSIMDSTCYKDGYDISSPPLSPEMEKLLGPSDQFYKEYRDNYYD